MSTGSTDSLVRLISSLSKAEKRSFKLYANRNSSSQEEIKYLQLFDFIDKTILFPGNYVEKILFYFKNDYFLIFLVTVFLKEVVFSHC